jgi:hypothetical protein
MLNELHTSSHQPVIIDVLAKFKPKFVLELGIGYYSTPLFRGIDYIGIDNNKEWVDRMNGQYPDMRFIHHDIGELKNYEMDDSKSFLTNAIRYYDSILLPDVKPRLLFVDNYASLRTIAINTLKDKFQYIIYHDSEAKVYRYDKIDDTGFEVIHYPTYPRTTLMIRNEDRRDCEAGKGVSKAG